PRVRSLAILGSHRCPVSCFAVRGCTAKQKTYPAGEISSSNEADRMIRASLPSRTALFLAFTFPGFTAPISSWQQVALPA
ncbi:MAG: hypothetical protein FWF95_06330, partial [Syntrophorhabdaceae bacterium]|nr:hypothetical protein [Syntrophorhabdaceae bacterium]